MELYREVEKSLIKTYRKAIWCKFTRALRDYKLVNEGDKVAVCISGGKDSMLMAKLFQELRRHGQIPFEAEYIVMDPGYKEANKRRIIENAKRLNIPVTVFESTIFDSVVSVEKSPCYLCARMRRGHLYAKAKELGCNKIALGHHFDDVIETILMGMFYSGQIQTMMPKLHSTNFSGMELIRPMYLIREADIIKWREHFQLAFLQCACRFTEKNNMEEDGIGDSKRQEIKVLIRKLREQNPLIEKHIFKSVEQVNLNTIISYKKDGAICHFLDNYEKGGFKEEENGQT